MSEDRTDSKLKRLGVTLLLTTRDSGVNTMPSSKNRLHLMLNKDLYRLIEGLSKKEKRSLSSITVKLIERAIALKEDFHFSTEADKRLNRKEKQVSHLKVWKKKPTPRSST
jgi:predicted DNA-binding protein